MNKREQVNYDLIKLFSDLVLITNETLYSASEAGTYDRKLITEWIKLHAKKYTLSELLFNGVIQTTKPYRGNRTVYTIWSLEKLQQTYKAYNIDDYNSVHQYIKELENNI